MEKLIYTPTGLCCSLLRGNGRYCITASCFSLRNLIVDLYDDVSVNMYVCLNVLWYLNMTSNVKVSMLAIGLFNPPTLGVSLQFGVDLLGQTVNVK